MTIFSTYAFYSKDIRKASVVTFYSKDIRKATTVTLGDAGFTNFVPIKRTFQFDRYNFTAKTKKPQQVQKHLLGQNALLHRMHINTEAIYERF